jgi:hypothetical protein
VIFQPPIWKNLCAVILLANSIAKSVPIAAFTTQTGGEHHLTIPNHDPLRPGTLRAILGEVMNHHHLTLEQVLQQLGLA